MSFSKKWFSLLFGKESPLFFHTQKKLVIISDEKITHFTLGKYLQGGLFALASLILIWMGFTSFFYLSHRLLVKRAYELVDVQKEKNAVLVNEIKELQIYLSGLNSYIDTDSVLKEDSREESKVKMQDTEDEEATNSEKEEDTENNTPSSAKITQNIQNNVKSRIAFITTLLKKTGIDHAVYANKNSFLKTTFKNYAPNYTNFDQELAHLVSLERLLYYLPFSLPVAHGHITSGFGKRRDPFSRHTAMHAGIDFAGMRHANILSTAPGKVIYAGRKGAYGLMVEIDHGKSIHTRYAHLSKIHVKSGSSVKRGEVIGKQGTTGRSTGEHLHYEIRYKNKPCDPASFLKIGKYVHKKRPKA